MTLNEAISELYRVAVVEGKSTSTKRLAALAAYCVRQLEARGLDGVTTEVRLPGGGRNKDWDVAWSYDAKARLAVSLKSILRNLAGTVPNRVDDLMGEAANLQLYSPEIVVGYLLVFDMAQDAFSQQHGMRWSELVRSRLSLLSGRRAPAWTIGTVEAALVVAVDFSNGPRLLTPETECAEFFDRLSTEALLRNPGFCRRAGDYDVSEG